jgi:small subunit ribosomal protein S11
MGMYMTDKSVNTELDPNALKAQSDASDAGEGAEGRSGRSGPGAKGKTVVKTKSSAAGDTDKVAAKKVGGRGSKKKARRVQHGIAHVRSSFNNTIITISDLQGNALASKSAGADFKGSRKSTPFAAQVAAEAVGKLVQENHGMELLAIQIKGPGPGRESVIKVFMGLGFKITEISDKTGIPHNGPRPPKKRRI